MFRQVVGTILRMAATHASSWLPIHGSHDVPAYGFERILEPPPLDVDTFRLLTEFETGSHTLDATWAEMFSPASLAAIRILAHQAGATVAAARARLAEGHDGAAGGKAPAALTTLEAAESLAAFHFPDDAWAKLIYDLIVVARKPDADIDKFVEALVPIYFGRVGSLIIETRTRTTDEAEIQVERQAREFELLKPYLVDRWNAAG
jgi:hypothetical protein